MCFGHIKFSEIVRLTNLVISTRDFQLHDSNDA